MAGKHANFCEQSNEHNQAMSDDSAAIKTLFFKIFILEKKFAASLGNISLLVHGLQLNCILLPVSPGHRFSLYQRQYKPERKIIREFIESPKVGINTIPWIEANSELSTLNGTLIQAGSGDLIKSFALVSTVFLSNEQTSEQNWSSLFAGLRGAFETDSFSFNEFLSSDVFLRDLVSTHGKLVDMALNALNLPLAKAINDFCPTNHMKITPESKAFHTAHFKANFGEFFSTFSIEDYKVLFSLGLDEGEMCQVFERNHFEALKLLEIICTESSSECLLRPAIKDQVLQIYNILNAKQKTEIQVALYFRSIIPRRDVRNWISADSELKIACFASWSFSKQCSTQNGSDAPISFG